MKKRLKVLGAMMSVVAVTATVMVVTVGDAGGSAFRPITGTCIKKGGKWYCY